MNDQLAFAYHGKQPRYGRNAVTIELLTDFDKANPQHLRSLLDFAMAAAREDDCFGNHINVYTKRDLDGSVVGRFAEVHFYTD